MTIHGDPMSDEWAAKSNQGRERRATLRALKTWSEAREGDGIPSLSSLTGAADMAVGFEIFTDNQFLIMFEASSADLVVIFYGDELPNMLDRCNVGNSLRHSLPPAMKDIFHPACMEAVNHGDAVYRHGAISTPSGDGVLCRSIFMPLLTEHSPDRVYVFGTFSNEVGGAELLAA